MVGKKSKTKPGLGDVVAVPLPVGGYAFMRVLKDSAFEVFKCHSPTVMSVDELAQVPVSHHQVGTDEAIRKGEWPIIGNLPVSSEAEAWGPPFATCYVAERNWWTMGAPRISHRGQERFADLSEVVGLEVLSVSNRPELIVDSIVRRMINGDESRVRRVPKP